MTGSEPVVLIERRGAAGILTINRPEVRNAVDREVTVGMAAALDALEHDDGIRAVVVTGAGSLAFCAGADLRAGPDRSPFDEALGGFAAITGRSFGKPLIAAVNGVALGGGAEICLACDLVVAEEHAVFGLPEVRRGLVARAGGVERLVRRIPRALALEMILTGEPIDAARALALGLVNRLVPRGGALPAALELTDAIALGAPLAVSYSLALGRASSAAGEEEALAPLVEQRRTVFASADRREGADAFVQRRAPIWSGR